MRLGVRSVRVMVPFAAWSRCMVGLFRQFVDARSGHSHCRSAERQLHLIDYRALILMNRKCSRAHPMPVDVDLKEGYPDGWA